MTYLREFGLTDEDLEEILDKLTNENWEYITSTRTHIKHLLSYFISIGITNIKEILMYRPNVLYENLSDMKKCIEESNVQNIVELINDDVDNFELINL